MADSNVSAGVFSFQDKEQSVSKNVEVKLFREFLPGIYDRNGFVLQERWQGFTSTKKFPKLSDRYWLFLAVSYCHWLFLNHGRNTADAKRSKSVLSVSEKLSLKRFFKATDVEKGRMNLIDAVIR